MDCYESLKGVFGPRANFQMEKTSDLVRKHGPFKFTVSETHGS